MCVEFIFEELFGNIQNEDLGVEIFYNGQILRPSTLKTDIFFKKNLMVAYVHVEYSTCQLSEKSRGGGAESTPPWSLRYRKRRGPERGK